MNSEDKSSYIPVKWTNALISTHELIEASRIVYCQIHSQFYDGKNSIYGKCTLHMNREEAQGLVDALRKIIAYE